MKRYVIVECKRHKKQIRQREWVKMMNRNENWSDGSSKDWRINDVSCKDDECGGNG